VKSEKSSEKHYSQRNSNGRASFWNYRCKSQKISYTPKRTKRCKSTDFGLNCQFSRNLM